MLSIAENGFPLLEQSAISGFPVSQNGCDLKAWLKIEGERCFILKPDVYNVIFWGKRQFHVSDDLALGLWKPENFPSLAGAGNFMVSHVASCTGDLVRAVSVCNHGCGPLTFVARILAFLSSKFKLGHYLQAHLEDRANALR